MNETYYQNYYRTHKENRKYRSQEYYYRMKDALFDILERKCSKCGFNDIRALQVDHINGGGAKEKRQLKVNFYKYILKKILNGSNEYQILCANCNWIKRAENKENKNRYTTLV